MALKARINWSFTPTDFFEEPFTSECDGILVQVSHGEITAELDRDRYERSPEIYQLLSEYIQSLFEGVRLLSHKDFDICEGGTEKDRPGGKKDIVLRIKPARLMLRAYPPDIKVSDAQGNVISDTRQDRIEAQRESAQLVVSKRGSDDTFDAIIESYANAVKDPDNELVHLYEIRDALTSRFGAAGRAISELGISRRKWKRLGSLANEPLNQGRHRGKLLSGLRDATPEELDEARSIAYEMIVLYANHIP